MSPKDLSQSAKAHSPPERTRSTSASARPEQKPSRIVHCEDAIRWLKEAAPQDAQSIITSLPDVSGLPHLSFQEWQDFFCQAIRLCLAAASGDCASIFYQTDIKRDGKWVNKAYLCQRVAEEEGQHLLWHKIFCRVPPDQTTFGRPAYSHLLCFSRKARESVAHSTPDVLSDRGDMLWSRAMGVEACRFACRWLQKQTPTRTVLDPFCGYGTVLAAANEFGFEA